MVKMYSVRECAELLGIKVRTMRKWIHDGKIKAQKFRGGKSWHISEAEVKRIMNENQG